MRLYQVVDHKLFTHSSIMRIPTSIASSLTRKMSSNSWNRLIRFVDDNGNETFGDPEVQNDKDFAERLAKNDLWAVEYKGQSPVSQLAKGERIHVKAVRELLRPSDVPTIRCIGLNYIKHSKWQSKCSRVVVNLSD